MKPKTCKSCKKKFTPTRPLQSVCSPRCAIEYANRREQAKLRKEAAQKRKEIKRQRESLENDNGSGKLSIPEIMDLIRIYKEKIKILHTEERYLKNLREKAKWLKENDAEELLNEIRGRENNSESKFFKTN